MSKALYLERELPHLLDDERLAEDQPPRPEAGPVSDITPSEVHQSARTVEQRSIEHPVRRGDSGVGGSERSTAGPNDADVIVLAIRAGARHRGVVVDEQRRQRDLALGGVLLPEGLQ